MVSVIFEEDRRASRRWVTPMLKHLADDGGGYSGLHSLALVYKSLHVPTDTEYK
jgi:hypothetical protein